MKEMKYLPVILMAWPYLGLILLRLAGRAFPAYLAMTVVVYALNILNACRYNGEGAELRLALWDMMIKLVHIPFYLIIFAVSLVLLMAMVVPALLFISPFMVMLLLIADFFLMVTSSSYGLSAVLRAKRAGKLSAGAAVCHIVLHLIFVLDTVSAVIVYIKLRRRK